MNFPVILAHLLFFGCVALLMAASTWWSKPLLAFYYNKVKRSNPIGRSDYIFFDRILSKHIPYYRKLSLDGRALFITRMFSFMQSKKFIGINGLAVTREMLILVSAAAAQLTFGLKRFKISGFHTIYLSPDEFYTPGDPNPYKGLVERNGEIYLSWADFLKGYQVSDDKYNLGLHEMAHALKTDLLRSNDFDQRFSGYLKNWLLIGIPEFLKMNITQESFLRAYGGRNMEEFFAVCIEHFFEAPAQFKKILPDIYNHLCFLLHQNPLNDREDYKFTEQFRREANSKSKIKMPKMRYAEHERAPWHFSLPFTVFGFFAGIISANIMSEWMNVTMAHFVLIGFFTFLLTAGIMFPYFIRKGIYSLFGCMAFFLLGVLLVTYASYLFINLKMPGTVRLEVYEINRVNPGDDLFWLEDDAYGDKPLFRKFSRDALVSPEMNARLAITLKESAFGIKVFQSNEIIYGKHDKEETQDAMQELLDKEEQD